LKLFRGRRRTTKKREQQGDENDEQEIEKEAEKEENVRRTPNSTFESGPLHPLHRTHVQREVQDLHSGACWWPASLPWCPRSPRCQLLLCQQHREIRLEARSRVLFGVAVSLDSAAGCWPATAQRTCPQRRRDLGFSKMCWQPLRLSATPWDRITSSGAPIPRLTSCFETANSVLPVRLELMIYDEDVSIVFIFVNTTEGKPTRE